MSLLDSTCFLSGTFAPPVAMLHVLRGGGGSHAQSSERHGHNRVDLNNYIHE